MTGKIPRITADKIVRLLQKHGFIIARHPLIAPHSPAKFGLKKGRVSKQGLRRDS